MSDGSRQLPEWMKAVIRAAAEVTSARPGAGSVGWWMPTPIIKEEVPLLGVLVDPLVGRGAAAGGGERTYLERTPHHAREWAAAFKASLLATLDLWIRSTREEAEAAGAKLTPSIAALEEARRIVDEWKVSPT